MIEPLRAVVRRSREAAFLREHRGKVRIGEGCRIAFRTLHADVQRLEIGNHVVLGERVILKGDTFRLGDNFWAGNGVTIGGQNASFETGRFCAVASGTTALLGQGNHRIQSLCSYPLGRLPVFESAGWNRHFDFETESKTYCRMGHDVFVGTACILMPNVHLSTGSVISAGSVVTQDVPPYAIVGGNPAQVIAYRFKQGLIRELLELRWWEWPTERILRNVKLFTTNLTARPTLSGIAIAD